MLNSDKDRIFDVFEHIKNNQVNSLDEFAVSVMLKTYLLYKRTTDGSYQLSSNGKVLRRMLNYDVEFQEELIRTCQYQNNSDRSYEECLSGAVNFACKYIRCLKNIKFKFKHHVPEFM
jgi:hypothetical protein